MGLVGGLFAPLASRCNLWLMTPEQFVRRPLEYLRCFGELGARLSALPAFGMDYIIKRVRPRDLEGMDFSAVKGIVTGAEVIDPTTLERFHDLLEPFGLSPGATLPAYGLAEATLAVTGVPMGERWTVRSPVSGGRPVVGCGPPLRDSKIIIVDEQGQTLTDGHIGEIVIRGASVSSGYQCAQEIGTVDEAEFHSGDAGFLVGGQLFPIGRLGDSIKIRGIPLFVERLEGELNKLGHLREDNAVLLGMRDGRPTAVWITEGAGAQDASDALKLLSRLTEGASLCLVQVGRGAITRTTSGKPRRRTMWGHFIGGRVTGKVTIYPGENDRHGN